MSVGFAGFCALRVWGQTLYEVFGDMPYQVGSSVKSKEFRDVDVVVMMSPEKFYSWAGPHGVHGARYRAICASFSSWGTKITGLPIDFKLQEVMYANANHTGQREAIGIRIDEEWIDPKCPFDRKTFSFLKAEEYLMANK